MKDLEAVSKVVRIPSSDERVYAYWSDLRNLQRMIPPNVEAEIQANENSCQVTVKGQTFEIHIIDKEEFKLIKIGTSETEKMGFTVWIQLKSLSPYETAGRLTIRAKVPLLMRPMLKGKLNEGVEKLAEALKMIPY